MLRNVPIFVAFKSIAFRAIPLAAEPFAVDAGRGGHLGSNLDDCDSAWLPGVISIAYT